MSVRSLESISKLASDYELVVLPDGTEILRERQTKAQAKMQALKIQIRNEKLRKALISLTEQVAISAERKRPIDTPQQAQAKVNQALKDNQDQLAMNNKPSALNSIDAISLAHNPDQASSINEPSAIQKQMISNSETKTERFELPNSHKKCQPKPAKFNPLNLRKLLFRQLASK